MLQDFLNGSWLGHSLHPVVVDVVVGGSTVVVVLDVLRYFGVTGLRDAITWTIGLIWLAGHRRHRHRLDRLQGHRHRRRAQRRRACTALINIVGDLLFVLSPSCALGGAHDSGFWLFLVGYLVISRRRLHRRPRRLQVRLHGQPQRFRPRQEGEAEFTPIMPAAELAEATPTKASFGATTLVLVRRGDVVFALKETCSHAGGPLSAGDAARRHDRVPVARTPPSAYPTAAVRHGPATTRQVAYRARINDGQVEVQGPID